MIRHAIPVDICAVHITWNFRLCRRIAAHCIMDMTAKRLILCQYSHRRRRQSQHERQKQTHQTLPLLSQNNQLLTFHSKPVCIGIVLCLRWLSLPRRTGSDCACRRIPSPISLPFLYRILILSQELAVEKPPFACDAVGFVSNKSIGNGVSSQSQRLDSFFRPEKKKKRVPVYLLCGFFPISLVFSQFFTYNENMYCFDSPNQS